MRRHSDNPLVIQTFQKETKFQKKYHKQPKKGTPEVPESKVPFLIGENSFIDMDVRAVNRKGNKIKLTPGNAKYPSEEKFEKIGKGMMTKDLTLISPSFDTSMTFKAFFWGNA